MSMEQLLYKTLRCSDCLAWQLINAFSLVLPEALLEAMNITIRMCPS